jgi:hypothetical protein
VARGLRHPRPPGRLASIPGAEVTLRYQSGPGVDDEGLTPCLRFRPPPARNLPPGKRQWHAIALVYLTTSVKQFQVLQPWRVAGHLRYNEEGLGREWWHPKPLVGLVTAVRVDSSGGVRCGDDIPGHEAFRSFVSRTILPRRAAENRGQPAARFRASSWSAECERLLHKRPHAAPAGGESAVH